MNNIDLYHIESDNNDMYKHMLDLTITNHRDILDKYKLKLSTNPDQVRLKIIKNIISNSWIDYENNYNLIMDKYNDYKSFDKKRYKSQINEINNIANEYLFLIDTIDKLLKI